MTVEFNIISIGTLSHNTFWKEETIVRSPHATTTLVTSGNRKILVDPALPAQVLDARLYERSGLRINDITDVFLTSFRSAHRGGLSAFEHANWYLHEVENQYARSQLEDFYDRSDDDTPEERKLIIQDMELLDRFKSAPEQFDDQVEIYPSPGASAGNCGLLLTPPVGAIVIAGDAVINADYLEHGRVWDLCYDIGQAMDSMRDILEIADMIVPGHDNLIPLLGKML